MSFQLGQRQIGDNAPAFIIAELSANHLQDINLAKKTIQAIAETGADCVKLQTYTPDTITLDCDNEYFQIKHGTLWDGKTLHKLYQEAFTPWEWQKELKDFAEQCGLIFFSSVFDKTSVDFLESIDVCAYKIASLEIMDTPLIEYAASKGKPIIFSTGVATLKDIEGALEACHNQNNRQTAILKCTSTYPAPLDDLNLRSIETLKEKFNTTVGLSDHTLTTSIAAASIALGAKIIEKHFILDRKMGGPDSAFSLEPQEFKTMVEAVREVETALGEREFRLTKKGEESRIFARSLFAVKDIEEGESFTEENIRSIRPGHGLAPKYAKDILGKKAVKSIKRGNPIQWDLVEEGERVRGR